MTVSTDTGHEATVGAFLAMWDTRVDDHGYNLPLPEGWQVRVVVMADNGITVTDWEYAVGVAIENSQRDWRPITANQVFNYTVGVLWNTVAHRSHLPLQARPAFIADPEAAERHHREQVEVAERAERWRREERERQRREYEQTHREVAAIQREAIKAPCTYCGAESTRPCLLPSGEPRLFPSGEYDHHAARRALVKRAVQIGMRWG